MAQRKVLFPFEFGAESMWADDLGNNRFRLDNVPLFAYGISYGDEFTAQPRENGLVFDHVISHGGMFTYRVTFNEGLSRDSDAQRLLDEAKSHAYLHSQYGDEQFAFSVRSGDDRGLLEVALEEGANRGFWDWELASGAEDTVP